MSLTFPVHTIGIIRDNNKRRVKSKNIKAGSTLYESSRVVLLFQQSTLDISVEKSSAANKNGRFLQKGRKLEIQIIVIINIIICVYTIINNIIISSCGGIILNKIEMTLISI